MNIALAQINPIIGDLDGNLAKHLSAINDLPSNTDLIVFPELSICGYPPKDLLNRPEFIQKCALYIEKIITQSTSTPELGIVLGYPAKHDGSRGLRNRAVLIQNGHILCEQDKALLPTYDVFDEARYFDSSHESHVISFKGKKLGLAICEDAWAIANEIPTKYPENPIDQLKAKGAEMVIVIMASPFELRKAKRRHELFQEHASNHHLELVIVNQVGGIDDLLFDGRSLVFNAEGQLIHESKAFESSVETVDLLSAPPIETTDTPDKMALCQQALCLGIKDYIQKCGFQDVVVGVSGGIDSAVVLALATEALGKDHVTAISMPSPYSSEGSVTDSKQLCQTLGIPMKTFQLHTVLDSFSAELNTLFGEAAKGITEENLQARIRGTALMAYSNQTGAMVLSTGNKSELSVGYCTLYGDMNGGLNPISDIPKLMVYKLAQYINRDSEIIPKAIIEKAPSAELRPDQKDQDSLPEYDVLDEIVRLYIEEHLSIHEISQKGFDMDTVSWICNTINKTEYKRQQAAPGIKVTSKAFGSGRKMVISAKPSYNEA